MRQVLRRIFPVVLAAALIAVPATTLAATRTSSPTRAVPASDWTTYHHDALRTGDGVIHGTFTSLHPKVAWHLPTKTVADRADQIFASPLVVGTIAFVTTLRNRVYAISLKTGRALWSATLGPAYTPPSSGTCGNISPTIGIVSTPVIVEGRGELYVVAGVGYGAGGHVPVHRLFGLSITTGRVLLDRVVDPPGQQVIFLLQRASLAIAKGRVIIGFGGNYGDCGSYHGWLVSVPEAGAGGIARYEVAVHSGKGAIWMGGGAPVIDRSGNIYVADGNGGATSSGDAYDFSDAVLKLTPTMRLLDWFAPATWYSDNASDADLGSSQPELLPNGKLFQIGKTHTVFVLNPSHLGHISGSVPTFSLCSEGGGTDANGGDAIVGSVVIVACNGGLDAVRYSKAPPYGTERWTQPATNGPPVYGAGLIWSIGSGTLHGLAPSTGSVKVHFNLGAEQNHFATPAIGDNMVVAASETTLRAFSPTMLRTVPVTDWPTYHHDLLRTGDGVIHGTYTALHPTVTWTLPTATASERNDQIYTSPLIVGSTAYVSTLENRVYAISLATQKTLWSRTLGATYTPPLRPLCGDIHPSIGIVSTPVIDEGRGELYVVADVGNGSGGNVPVHRLFGLSIATGKVLLDRVVDPPAQQIIYLLQRASLAIAKGRVIFGFGGNAGDCGTYHGWVMSVPESGSAPIDSYEVAAQPGQGRGAVWMGGAGPVVDANGDVFVSDGNGNATHSSDAYDYSDAVLKLSSTMKLLDYFAPSTWYTDNSVDHDLGSSAPQLLPTGKLIAIGKTHIAYVLDPASLGHIDGSVPTFPLCTEGSGNIATGGDTIVGPLVVVACTKGLDAATISSSPPYGGEAWAQPATKGPAVYGGGIVWSINVVPQTSTGTLYGLDPATGNVKLQYTIGLVQNHFPTPSIGDNMVVVATETSLLGFPPA